MKALIVTRDIVGPVRNGGIGTACTSLSEFLVEEGHDVSILYALNEYSADNNFAYWKRYYTNKLGIELISMPPIGNIEAPPVQAISYMIYRWLMSNGSKYDVIYAPEWRGLMFYPLLAKEQGLLSQDLKIIVGTHSPTMWVYDGNNQYPDGYDPLYTNYMEKICIELADEVVHPSQHMMDWIGKEWGIDRGVVIQNLMPYNTKDRVIANGKESLKASYVTDLDEIIFFGRFTAKKGIDVFCNAIDLLDTNRGIQVTFLGKDDMIYGVPASNYIREKAKNWDNVRLSFYMDKDQKEAVKYLKSRKSALLVMGSVFENLPYTVMESIGLGKIILVPATSGGTLELFKNPDLYTYERTPTGLAIKLAEMLAADKVRVPDMAVPQWRTKELWREILESVAAQPVRSMEGMLQPKVSVCMAHYKRPDMLKVALESLNNQTYPRELIEIVVTDDCSPDGSYEILEQYKKDGLIDVLQQNEENMYLGATRNRSINASSGEYILIMDDDNAAKPKEIEVLVKAAMLSNADAVSVAMDKFSGALNPEYGEQKGIGLFLGGSALCGLTKNTFGDANGLYLASVLKDNPYTEVHGVGFEDWELLATLVIKGYKVTHCPEPLFYYRLHAENKDSMLMSGNGYADMTRMLRAYQSALSPVNEEIGKYLPLYIHGLQKAVFDASRDVYMMQKMLQQAATQGQQNAPQILTP